MIWQKYHVEVEKYLKYTLRTTLITTAIDISSNFFDSLLFGRGLYVGQERLELQKNFF